MHAPSHTKVCHFGEGSIQIIWWFIWDNCAICDTRLSEWDYANKTIVTSQMNHHVIWIGWQQGCKHVSRIRLLINCDNTIKSRRIKNKKLKKEEKTKRNGKLRYKINKKASKKTNSVGMREEERFLILFTVKSSQACTSRLHQWTDYLNSEPASRFKNAIMKRFNNELIIGKLNPLVAPRIRLMGLMFKKNQLNIDFGNN